MSNESSKSWTPKQRDFYVERLRGKVCSSCGSLIDSETCVIHRWFHPREFKDIHTTLLCYCCDDRSLKGDALIDWLLAFKGNYPYDLLEGEDKLMKHIEEELA